MPLHRGFSTSFWVFLENGPLARGQGKFYPDAEVLIGGSGVKVSGSYNWLPGPMQKVKPDYDLYNGLVCKNCGKLIYYCKCLGGPQAGNMFYSLGFTTRGCIRNCPFCIVRDKEGPFKKWNHIKDFHNEKFRIVHLLDNNWLANKNWFLVNTDYIISRKLRVIENGMDIRVLDKEIATRLKEIKFYGNLHFAFDRIEDEEEVVKGINILKKVGIKIRHNVQFYVLVGYDTTPDQDKYRCRLLKKLGTNAFVMQYKRTPWTKKIAWWANRKKLFWSCDIDDLKYGLNEVK